MMAGRKNDLKAKLVSLITSGLGILFASFFFPRIVESPAVHSGSTPLTVHFIVDQSTTESNQPGRGVLIWQNETPHTLVDARVTLTGASLSLEGESSLPEVIEPYRSGRVEYILQRAGGVPRNFQVKVYYIHQNPNKPGTHSYNQYVTPKFVSASEFRQWVPTAFNWPEYVIPFLSGLIFGRLGRRVARQRTPTYVSALSFPW